MISIIAQERLLGAVLGSAFVGGIVFEQRRRIFGSITDDESVKIEKYEFSGLESLASNHVICTYTGKLEPIKGNPRWMWKVQNLLIEDPFDQTDNSARCVGASNLTEITRAFKDMYRKLSSNSVLKDRTFLLSNFLRPEIISKFNA